MSQNTKRLNKLGKPTKKFCTKGQKKKNLHVKRKELKNRSKIKTKKVKNKSKDLTRRKQTEFRKTLNNPQKRSNKRAQLEK